MRKLFYSPVLWNVKLLSFASQHFLERIGLQCVFLGVSPSASIGGVVTWANILKSCEISCKAWIIDVVDLDISPFRITHKQNNDSASLVKICYEE
jgi:hypothetical protein